MKIRTDWIKWDTDDSDVLDGLPDNVELEVDSTEDIADALSDEYGWCVRSFDYTVIDEAYQRQLDFVIYLKEHNIYNEFDSVGTMRRMQTLFEKMKETEN